ncbi:hypothetical protein SARC_08374 [Sphaeroforma arctica JP610]|uniref:Uncharacterized protein n=1 Tax=Sphaeroforma arctica JP610 TaxID=667725 RepID=A0A0L0FQZ2_9EUKA|nr:hypothetical protein SARC_08374 [Sphaeroforma arctica JP610]KNC79227.1 hypothetical protein SARC_08374 [Sphaeroforma arctica JP610]|eukprot:XP_014153129.1 hypothetical protein SARC_08374 [Sphaeroforma arctica JP610]
MLVCPYMPNSDWWGVMAKMLAREPIVIPPQKGVFFRHGHEPLEDPPWGPTLLYRIPYTKRVSLSDEFWAGVHALAKHPVAGCALAPALKFHPQRAPLVPTDREEGSLVEDSTDSGEQAQALREGFIRRREQRRQASAKLLAKQGDSPYTIKGLQLTWPEVRNVIGAAHNVYMHAGADKVWPSFRSCMAGLAWVT